MVDQKELSGQEIKELSDLIERYKTKWYEWFFDLYVSGFSLSDWILFVVSILF
jgi:hypothetical protein